MNRVATYYRLMPPPEKEPMVRFIVLAKPNRDRYVFFWNDDDRYQTEQVLRMAGRWASDPTLSFTWADAAKLSRIIRSKP